MTLAYIYLIGCFFSSLIAIYELKKVNWGKNDNTDLSPLSVLILGSWFIIVIYVYAYFNVKNKKD